MLIRNGNIGSKASQGTLANPRNYRKVVDVEEILRWTYQDQAADAVTKRVVAGLYPAGCKSNLMGIERNGLLGTKIDCGGLVPVASNDLHPDAEAVHDAVCALGVPLWTGLLITYAKEGGRPDWMEGEEPRPIAVRRANGKPLVEYHDPMTCRKPAFCLLRYDPEPDHLAFVREVYVTWWQGLAALAGRLGDLDSHAVTGPAVPREPWREGC